MTREWPDFARNSEKETGCFLRHLMNAMKKGRIIIINHYGITPDMAGATKHYDMACHFAEKGDYEIEFWMCGCGRGAKDCVDGLKGPHLQYKYCENGVKIVKIKSIADRGGLVMRQLNIMGFDFITGAKILFSRDIKGIVLSMPPITFFATDAAKLRGIKMVADVEDLWPLFMEDMGVKNQLASRYMEHYANRTYNAAAAIEAVSNGMLSFVKGKLKDKSKTAWLAPLGVNLALFEGEPERKYIEQYPWKDDFIAIYAGAHGKANDIEALLEMIREFNKFSVTVGGKKVSFVFIGSGENKEKLIKLRDQYHLDNTYFEDAVPGNVIPKILKNVDLCITNLKKVESFKLVRPNKIFHYMAAKKPVICGIWGEAQQIVEDAGAGRYIDFTDAVSAAKEMKDFIQNADFEKCGANGYKYVSEYGDREKIFDEFYENLLEVIQ